MTIILVFGIYNHVIFIFSQVSRGAECVMISKKFFITQASELTKKWIRHNVSIISFPRTIKHVNSNVRNVAKTCSVITFVIRSSECTGNRFSLDKIKWRENWTWQNANHYGSHGVTCKRKYFPMTVANKTQNNHIILIT